MTNQINNLEAVVFAAGKGKRMESETPKVLHEVNGKPLIFYTLEKLISLGIKSIVVVVGYKAEEVRQTISAGFHSINPGGCNIKYAFQPEQLGTANSLEVALPDLNPETFQVLVLNGDDSAFYSVQTLEKFITSHNKSQAKVSALTLEIENPGEVGRVIRDEDGSFEKILEIKEYEANGLRSNEINCGAYIFDVDWVKENLGKVPLSEKGEYYITELLNITHTQGNSVNLFRLEDPNEWHGVNTQEDLEEASQKFI